MVKIKICGLKTLGDVEAVNQAMPDYVGFVFAPSKRQITLKQGKVLLKYLNPTIKKVGVFVNESAASIEEFQRQCNLDVIQLHGEDSGESCTEFAGDVWKVIRVREKKDIDREKDIKCSGILLDTYHCNFAGGSGVCFNWGWLQEYPFSKPWGLAGGIDIYNIEEALDCNSNFIDVSSGVETEGKKDKKKIIEMVRRVRAYEK